MIMSEIDQEAVWRDLWTPGTRKIGVGADPRAQTVSPGGHRDKKSMAPFLHLFWALGDARGSKPRAYREGAKSVVIPRLQEIDAIVADRVDDPMLEGQAP